MVFSLPAHVQTCWIFLMKGLVSCSPLTIWGPFEEGKWVPLLIWKPSLNIGKIKRHQYQNLHSEQRPLGIKKEVMTKCYLKTVSSSTLLIKENNGMRKTTSINNSESNDDIEASDSDYRIILRLLWLILFNQVLLAYSYFAMLGSTVQQSESILHIHLSPLFWISFPFRLPQSRQESSLCYTVGSHYLLISYMVVYICQFHLTVHPTPHSSLGNHKFVFYICDSFSALQISSSISLYPRFHIQGYY